MKNIRVHYLDSIRGLAALVVLIGHYISGQPKEGGISETSLKWIFAFFNPDAAVAVFFVLSGVVLSLRYVQVPKEEFTLHYPRYIVGRIFRLFPAYCVMFLIFYLHKYGHSLSFSFLGTLLQNEGIILLEELTLHHNINNAFGPGWTLNIELILSLYLPLLMLYIVHYPKYYNYMLFAILMSPVIISGFYWHFALGVWIAYHFETIQQYSFKPWQKIGLVLAFLFFFTATRAFSHLYFDLHLWILNFMGYFHITNYSLAGIAATILIIMAINFKGLQQFLSWRPLVFLGTIAYGVYLSHWLFLIYIMPNNVKGLSDSWQITFFQAYLIWGLIVLFGSIAMGTLLYYFVELPCIRWGRRVAARLAD